MMTYLFSLLRRIRSTSFDLSLSAFLWLIRKITAGWSKEVMKTSMNCRVACFVEVWAKAAPEQPVDRDSKLYKGASDAIDYYLSRPPKMNASPGHFEQMILPHIYLSRTQQQPNLSKKKQYYRFVRQHKIAKIIREFANIQFLINLKATEQLSWLQTSFLYKETPTTPYWKAKVAPQRLPEELRGNVRLGRIKSYLKRRIKRGKTHIARSNYPKLDFLFSDIVAFIAVSGTLLILLGYLHVLIVSAYFGVPYQRYFQASDYIASGANSIGALFLGAVLGIAFSLFYRSTLDSYSLQAASIEAQSFSSRLNDWVLHFIGVGSLLTLGVVFYNERRIDPLAFLTASLYVGMQLIGRFCVLYFSNPLRALFFMSLAYVATVQTVTSTLREIDGILNTKGATSIRKLEFKDQTYSEPEWRILDFTSKFVIMRHQLDGAIRVMPNAELKRIDSIPAANIERRQTHLH
jgi:hypothetical protein